MNLINNFLIWFMEKPVGIEMTSQSASEIAFYSDNNTPANL